MSVVVIAVVNVEFEAKLSKIVDDGYLRRKHGNMLEDLTMQMDVCYESAISILLCHEHGEMFLMPNHAGCK